MIPVEISQRTAGHDGHPRKIKTIFEHLKTDGVSQTALNGVYAPIGLDIGSNTPEEIAVSIAAKVITVRN